jgi:hypothetical protein
MQALEQTVASKLLQDFLQVFASPSLSQMLGLDRRVEFSGVEKILTRSTHSFRTN